VQIEEIRDEQMTVKFGRRFFISLLGSAGAFFSFGASAQDVKAPQTSRAVVGTPIFGITQFVGPVIAESTSELSSGDTYVKKSQNIVSRPSQTIDRTGYHPNVKE
jgi:hypothetical protein